VAGHVFVSYSHADAEYVERLVAHLAAAGIPAWMDHKIRLGSEWAFEIETQIRECGVFVPVMSANSATSTWVDREVDFAQELRKPIVPLALDGVVPLRLRGYQYESVADGRMPTPAFIETLRAQREPRPVISNTTQPVRAAAASARVLDPPVAAEAVAAEALGAAEVAPPDWAKLEPGEYIERRTGTDPTHATRRIIGFAVAAGLFGGLGLISLVAGGGAAPTITAFGLVVLLLAVAFLSMIFDQDILITNRRLMLHTPGAVIPLDLRELVEVRIEKRSKRGLGTVRVYRAKGHVRYVRLAHVSGPDDVARALRRAIDRANQK
jgi:hypothetical protein